MKKNIKQNVLVVCGAIALIVLSASITVVFTSGVLDRDDASAGGFKNITFTDATITCDEELASSFSRDESQRVLDNHSSRFENELSVYKIFYDVYVKDKKQNKEFYVTCIVRARDGKIIKFELLENQEESGTEPIKKGGDKFIEWPR